MFSGFQTVVFCVLIWSFLVTCTCVHAQLLQFCPTLCDPIHCSPLSTMDRGKDTGVGFHALLQGIFPDQGIKHASLASNAMKVVSLPTEPPGKPSCMHIREEKKKSLSSAIRLPILWNGGCMLSCFSPVRLFATLWTIAQQIPLSMGFSRQEY